LRRPSSEHSISEVHVPPPPPVKPPPPTLAYRSWGMLCPFRLRSVPLTSHWTPRQPSLPFLIDPRALIFSSSFPGLCSSAASVTYYRRHFSNSRDLPIWRLCPILSLGFSFFSKVLPRHDLISSLWWDQAPALTRLLSRHIRAFGFVWSPPLPFRPRLCHVFFLTSSTLETPPVRVLSLPFSSLPSVPYHPLGSSGEPTSCAGSLSSVFSY